VHYWDNVAIKEFYSLLRATILGAKNVELLKVLFAEQSLTTIMGRVPAADWKQWDMDRPNWYKVQLSLHSRSMQN
jgi:hypothetical protein